MKKMLVLAAVVGLGLATFSACGDKEDQCDKLDTWYQSCTAGVKGILLSMAHISFDKATCDEKLPNCNAADLTAIDNAITCLTTPATCDETTVGSLSQCSSSMSTPMSAGCEVFIDSSTDGV